MIIDRVYCPDLSPQAAYAMSHKKYRQETNCLNCSAEVNGKFCSACGQENIELEENFFHMVAHTIGDFFHFDSKFFRSFIPLLTKPGFLTRQYLEGKRMTYLHPLRLFFFITLVMVIIGSAYYKKFEKEILAERIRTTSDRETVSPVTADGDAYEAKRIISSSKNTLTNTWTYLKYISFLLLPLYALGFKLLYIRWKIPYTHHLIYAFHVQSFVYIVLSLALLVPLFGFSGARTWFSDVVFFFAVIYVVLSLRYLYKQSWIKTLLKSFLAVVFFVFTTAIFFGLMLLMNYVWYGH